MFEGRHEGGAVLVGNARLPCPEGAPKGPVDYIVRPEKVNFAGTDALLRGRVAARVFLGNHWLFQVDTPLGTLQVTQANAGMPSVAEGDDVGLAWAGEHARAVARGA